MKKIQELIKKICKLNPTLDRKAPQSEIMNIIKRIEVHPDEELFDELDEVLERTLNFSPKKTKTKW
jgi:hypothetical protein